MTVLSSPVASVVSRYGLRSKRRSPSERPLSSSSTDSTFAYARTSTTSPGSWRVQSIGSRWTIGSSVHWLWNRKNWSFSKPAVSTAPKNDVFTGKTS